MEITIAETISTADVAAAIKDWRDTMPEKFDGILQATPQPA
jgi:hypothetical protein